MQKYINASLAGVTSMGYAANISFIYIYIYTYNSTTRHLKYSYISILKNLLRTDNETKSVKTIYN